MTNVFAFLMRGWGNVRRHPYLWTFAGFLLWVAVLDQHSIYCSIQDYRQSRSLEREKEDYLEKIRNYSQMLNELKTNDENLVKFAREQYYMKAKDEDVFIVKER
jgi:cell division protein FtsB